MDKNQFMKILEEHIDFTERALAGHERADDLAASIGVNSDDRHTTRLQGRLGALYSLRADLAHAVIDRSSR